jgi:hypothetical protein
VVEACSSINAGPLIRLPARSEARRNVGVGSNPVPKNTGRLPVNAAAGGLRCPSWIVACGGLRMTPVTVLRKLTISARSCGAEVP